MTTSRPSGGTFAFTLVEVLIVLVVLLIAAAVVVPSIGTAGDSQALSAAEVLQSDLEVTRSLALTTQQPHSLVFAPNHQAYKVVVNYHGEAYAAVQAVPHPVAAGKRLEVTFASLNGMSRVRVGAAVFGADTYVTFNSQGEPSAAGFVTLMAGRTEMKVSVASLTGAVTVSRTAG